MRESTLLPDRRCLRLERVEFDEDAQCVSVFVRSKSRLCACPQCGVESERVHSWYERKLTDLPCQGLAVRIVWTTRKLFCLNRDCSQKIFAERQPAVAAPLGRRTQRLAVTLKCIAIACGGELGSRLAERLGMQASADTLLREIRKVEVPARETPRALGVDDWAFCKGRNYGTLLCDLERGCAVDLLPERSAESLSQWLQENDGVEIISRDRADVYRKGATAGAPDAVQVADRFHLMQNVREAFGRALESKSKQIREAVKQAAAGSAQQAATQQPTESGSPTATHSDSRARRFANYEKVLELHQQGISARSIASQLGIHRGTVGRYLNTESFPERAQRVYHSSAGAFKEYLWDRWLSGCRNVRKLWSEIADRGFTGSYYAVRRFLARWKEHPGSTDGEPPAAVANPSAKQLSWLLVKEPEELSSDEQQVKSVILNGFPELQSAWELAQDFVEMLRQRTGEKFNAWIERATASDAPVPIQRFASGLQADQDAVEAALTLPWSNGSSEGHINRLKLIKRQMYGRANFDLLRARFLLAL